MLGLADGCFMISPVKNTQRQISGLIRKILLVDEITREHETPFQAQSLPGHLIHVVLSGAVTQLSEGRHEEYREGNAVWYHENEPVRGRIVRAPWRFITINFDAPTLAPPADRNRVLLAGPKTLQLARQLLDLWLDESAPPLQRQLRAMATLLELIVEIHPADGPDTSLPVYPTNARERWWDAEKRLRMLLEDPLPLERIAAVAGMSARTMARACKAVTGMSPGQRLRELRMAYATSLLEHTDLPVTEVAMRVGFTRVQEFCRAFKKHTGLTPGGMRQAEPSYKYQKTLPTSRQPGHRC